jgi:hypothetical protein
MVAQVALSELQREGIDLNVGILPSARTIGRHLRPTVGAMCRTEAGIEFVTRQTVPGGNAIATAPVSVALLLPAVQSARAAARRTHSMNQLKQIGLALHMHHDRHKTFPPAYVADEDGKPLLSWRVTILPYLGQQALYGQFRLDEPWDSEHNKKLIARMPQLYRAPASNAEAGKTVYLTIRDDQAVFPGAEGVPIRDIKDGTSNTIMVVEASDAKAVPWTKPQDFEVDEKNPTAGLIGLRPGGFLALLSDGSVHLIDRHVGAEVIPAMLTRNGGEPVDPSRVRRRR